MRLSAVFAAMTLLAAPFAFAAPAIAQPELNLISWVASTGSNLNDCSEENPCRLFSEAIAKTAANGTVKCKDSGFFGGPIISKPITISCAAGSAAFGGVLIDANAGRVVLRGLDFVGTFGEYGVRVAGGGVSLVIEDSIIHDKDTVTPYGHGVMVTNPSGMVEVSVRNTRMAGNRGSGLTIVPTGSGSARVTVANSSSTDNGFGIRLDASSTSGRVDMTLVDTVLDGNGSGLVVVGGAAQMRVLASRIAASNNAGHGVKVANATAQLRLSDSDVSGNGIGVEAVSGGTIQSTGNNRIYGNNGSNGAPPQIVPMQ